VGALRLFGLDDDESSTLTHIMNSRVVGLLGVDSIESLRAVTSHRVQISQQCDYMVKYMMTGDAFSCVCRRVRP